MLTVKRFLLQEVIDRLKKGEILPVRLNGPFGGDHFEWRKYDVIHLYAGGIGVSVRNFPLAECHRSLIGL